MEKVRGNNLIAKHRHRWRCVLAFCILALLMLMSDVQAYKGKKQQNEDFEKVTVKDAKGKKSTIKIDLKS